jgi:hypothetical protein
MIKIKTDFNLDQKVSSQLAFIFLLVLSFVVAWCTVNAGQEVADNSKTSAAFNLDKRIKNTAPIDAPLILNKN